MRPQEKAAPVEAEGCASAHQRMGVELCKSCEFAVQVCCRRAVSGVRFISRAESAEVMANTIRNDGGVISHTARPEGADMNTLGP